MTCARCGTANRPGARFCDACGSALAPSDVDGAPARKIVTIVFADLVGSTSLHERLDAESARRLMDGYYATLRAVVAAHGGTVVKLLGDGVMAAFGVPRVAEDDAIRAVRAAVAMQEAVRALPDRGLGLRVAVNTGEVVVRADQTDVVGDPVNVAARLQAEARDGDVLIGEATQRLVADLVTLAPLGTIVLKGRNEAVRAERVLSLQRPADTPPVAFVGREAELGRLATLHDEARTTRRPRLAVVLGSPGLGKSRLLAEFGRRVAAATTVLNVRCEPSGGATFAPIAASLRASLGLASGVDATAVRATVARLLTDDPDRARIADGVAALLTGTPPPPEETFFAVRRLLAALATREAVVLAIDDLQWAEPLLLDLVEHLVEWSTTAPLLIVGAARPELRELRPSLAASGAFVSDVIELDGLDAAAATRLAASIVGADALPPSVADRVLATSEGNPLFVSELVRMLVHDGALRRAGDRWIAGAELSGLDMPPSIQALLAARLERLRPDERTVLERAAVVGRVFSRAAVAHLLPPEERGDLDARLAALRRSDLIEPEPGSITGEPVLRFHHALLRDAAYRRLLKDTRAELHTRLADWLEARAPVGPDDEETIGWHLEQAHRHLQVLGAIDAHGRVVGERAARHLGAAGRRALARDDASAAASLLGRAIARLDGDDTARAELALDWCEALLAAGAVGPAGRALDELGRFVDRSPRLHAWHACFVGQRAVLTRPHALRATAESVARAAEVLAAAGDSAGEGKARSVQATALARLGRMGECETALDQALAAVRRTGAGRRVNAVLAGVPVAALWGPSSVTHASGRCLDVVRLLRMDQGSPAVEAVAVRCQGVLEALRGRIDAARRMTATARSMVEKLGVTHAMLEADVFAGLVELLAGNARVAEPTLRGAYDGLRSHGLAIDAARAGALLGRALLASDRAAEAEALSHDSEALAGDDLQAGIAWRGVRAEALARRGEHAAGIELARAAVTLAAATDALLDQADARLALAASLGAAGRHDEAGAERARAIELWEAKGASLLVERARGVAGHPAAIPGDAAPTAARATPALENVASRLARRPRDAGSARDPAGDGALLATRGERLALVRVRRSDAPDARAHDGGHMRLVEVDAAGTGLAIVDFAADALESAYAELDERYATGEAAAHPHAVVLREFCRTFAAREWSTFARLLAPEIVVCDHRLLGWAPLRGTEAYVDAIRSLVDLAPDTRLRIDHVRMTDHGALCVTTWIGSHDGGAFETPSITVFQLDDRCRPRRFDQYDLDQLDEALRQLRTIG